MLRCFSIVPPSFVFVVSSSLHAQLAPQPFLPPPLLTESQKPNAIHMRAMAAILSTPLGTACDPAAEVNYNGSIVTVTLGVEEHQNAIYNPGNPATNYEDTVSLRSYGGCLTGPIVETKPGTTLRINLKNDLSQNDVSCPQGLDPVGQPGCFNTINMHFHGLHVSPSGNSDNVLLNITPKTEFNYEVNIPEDHPSGTFWYHAHRHGSTAMQVASGASGALIIRGNRPYVPATGDNPAIPGDIDTILKDSSGPLKEQIFLFQQIPYACFDDKGNIIRSGSQDTDPWECPAGKIGVVEDFNQQLSSATVWDFSGRYTSINGVVQPTITNIKAGEIQRWRLIHGGIHDTINLQIVQMIDRGPNAVNALRGVIPGTPAAQEKILNEVCPNRPPDDPSSVPSVDLVPQFEIASDGLTRTSINPIGIKDGKPEKSTSGGIGTNFLQPGYRSDVLVTFPHEGTYCILNQAATPDERASARNNRGPGGQGPNRVELLATVIVKGGRAFTVDPQTYVLRALYDGNKQLPPGPREGLLTGKLEPWEGMPDLKDEVVSSELQKIDFFIGNPPSPPTSPATPPTPPDTAWTGAFGFFVNYKSYDPDRIDFTRQVGTVDDWQLTAQGEPHIFHIHVNPFEIMDVVDLKTNKSIFDSTGVCLVAPDSLGLQNQYCGMWHQFKDTVFVQNGYKVLIRTRYDRYIGEFVIHCHILDHEDGGMMTNIQIVPDIGAPGYGLGMSGMNHAHTPQ